MRKRLVLLLSVLLLLGCGSPSTPSPKTSLADDPVTIYIATDLHYISPSLTDNGPIFTTMTEQSDGKANLYCEPLLQSLVATVLEAKPDALVLSGDLTFNGEKASHEDLAVALAPLEEAGIEVLVLPGNHDLENPYAYSFQGDTAYYTSSITEEEFLSIYKNLGPNHALAQDTVSTSYVVALRKDLWILLIDSNNPDNPNVVQEETLSFVQTQLEKAQEENIQVITVTHQNVLSQSHWSRSSYMIENHQEVADLLQAYGVTLNLAGHIHCQHWTTKDNLTELVTSSLAVAPHHFGVLEIASDSMSYHTEVDDVTSWAQSHGIKGYENFAQTTQELFDQCTTYKLADSIHELDLDEAQQATMLDTVTLINRDFFAGSLELDKETIRASAGWNLWKSYRGIIDTADYLVTLMNERGTDFNVWTNK